jgi:hypothetical protein
MMWPNDVKTYLWEILYHEFMVIGNVRGGDID